jgi:hypothetical protein
VSPVAAAKQLLAKLLSDRPTQSIADLLRYVHSLFTAYVPTAHTCIPVRVCGCACLHVSMCVSMYVGRYRRIYMCLCVSVYGAQLNAADTRTCMCICVSMCLPQCHSMTESGTTSVCLPACICLSVCLCLCTRFTYTAARVGRYAERPVAERDPLMKDGAMHMLGTIGYALDEVVLCSAPHRQTHKCTHIHMGIRRQTHPTTCVSVRGHARVARSSVVAPDDTDAHTHTHTHTHTHARAHAVTH